MKYRDIGQPVIIPGDMSVGTYVLVGMKGAMTDSFGTSCHGAGRKMSRAKATASLNVNDIESAMAGKGITLRRGSEEGLVEEAPQAYKDVDEVVSVVCNSGLTGKVARLRPIGTVGQNLATTSIERHP